ncbi:MAG: hydrogenase maturation peptidase HycI [Candidatus Margulisiibacteriota bacterium]
MQSPDLRTALQIKLKNISRAALIGVGAELKGDDAAGLLVAQRLKDKRTPHLEVIFGGTAPENFTGEIRKINPSHLIIIDAAEMGREPGHIELIDKEKIGGYTFSTHSLPLKIMIDYILNDIQCEIIIIGIEPKTMKFGGQVSSEIEDAVDEVASIIHDSLKSGASSAKIGQVQKEDFMRAAGIGVEIAAATFLGAFIGYQIDLRLNSAPIGLAVGAITGAVAGLWNAARIGLSIK